MKKILIVHYGDWLNARIQRHEQELQSLVMQLNKLGIFVKISLQPPIDEELDSSDAIVFITRYLLCEARKIKIRLDAKGETDKCVFVITQIIEKNDDKDGVIPITKKLGSEAAANLINEILSKNKEL